MAKLAALLIEKADTVWPWCDQRKMYNITNCNSCQNVWLESLNEKTVPDCRGFSYKARLKSLKYLRHEKISFKWVECSTSGSKTSVEVQVVVNISGFATWSLLWLLSLALVALKVFMNHT